MPSTSDVESVHALSPLQQGMLFHALEHPGTGLYTIQNHYALRGALDISSFRNAWRIVVNRHQALRSAFSWKQAARFLQVSFKHCDVPFTVIDARALRGTRAATIDRGLRAAVAHGFALDRAPLMHLLLVRESDADYRLVWSYHHLLLDGWSSSLVLREVAVCYRALVHGTPIPPGDALPYRVYIDWLARQDPARAEAFWRPRLAGKRAPTLIGCRDPRSRTRRPVTLTHRLTPEATATLDAYARRLEVTLNTVVQAAWAIGLGRHCGDDDVMYGTTVSGRPADVPGMESIVGLFINTLPVRVALDHARPIASWLRQMQQDQAAALEYQHSALVDIHGWSDIPRTAPLFEALLVFENYPMSAPAAEDGPALALEMRDLGSVERVNYPLMLVVVPGRTPAPRTLTLRLTYDVDRLDAWRMELLLAQVADVLTRFATVATSAPLSALWRVEGATREAIVHTWNATTQAEAATDLIEAFDHQAARTPTHAAIVDETGTTSYAQLAAQVHQVAHWLRRHGVGRETIVALDLPRDVRLAAALLGVLKAGGAYMPLEPHAPAPRLFTMLDDADVSMVMTTHANHSRFDGSGRRVVTWEEITRETASSSPMAMSPMEMSPTAMSPMAMSPIEIDVPVIASQLAYVLYTSGSTGRPKGVMVTRGGLANYITWAAAAYGLTDRHVSLVTSSITFDLTITTLLVPLARGAQIRLLEDGRFWEVSAALPHDRPALLKITPSHLPLLSHAPAAGGSQPHVMVIGGEALHGEHLREWARWYPGTCFVNEYGPTETVVGCAVHALHGGELPPGPVPIGRPIANTRLYVLDRCGELVPPGVAGELFIGGAGVARGFHGRPGLSADRFVPDGLGGDAGGRLYRTGDRVRWRGDGSLEYLGRTDDQVKVRGYRIELGEIEAALNGLTGVRQSAAVLREPGTPAAQIVGYVSVEAPVDGQTLREALAARLPAHLVPATIVVLDTLPLTPNGKVDRQALPAPSSTATPAPSAWRSPIEEIVAGIWTAVLPAGPPVTRETHFFERGGHSLTATQVRVRVGDACGADVPLRAIFEAPTLAAFASRIDACRRGAAGRTWPPLRAGARPPRLPVSFAQRRLWVLAQLDPASAAYHCPSAVRLTGPLSIGALRQALTAVAARHESLRTRFPVHAGEPEQWIDPARPVAVPVIDLSHVAAEARRARGRRLSAIESRRPFDLARGPLLRATVLRCADDDHVLLVTVHHIVCDGWSMGVLLREFADAYNAARRGASVAWPPLPVQYADVACWEHASFTDGALDAELAWWRERLADLPVLDLTRATVADRAGGDRAPDRATVARPSTTGPRSATLVYRVDAPLTARVSAMCRRTGVTTFMALMAAFQTVLHLLTRREDLVVGMDVAGRRARELEGLIGFFANQVVLRFTVSGDPSFATLLARTRAATLDALSHQDAPFDLVVNACQPGESADGRPLFRIKVAQAVPHDDVSVDGLHAEWMPVELGAPKFDLLLNLVPREHEIACEWVYDATRFARARIEEFAALLALVLELASGDVTARVSAIEAAAIARHAQEEEGRRHRLHRAREQRLRSVRARTDHVGLEGSDDHAFHAPRSQPAHR